MSHFFIYIIITRLRVCLHLDGANGNYAFFYLADWTDEDDEFN